MKSFRFDEFKEFFFFENQDFCLISKKKKKKKKTKKKPKKKKNKKKQKKYTPNQLQKMKLNDIIIFCIKNENYKSHIVLNIVSQFYNLNKKERISIRQNRCKDEEITVINKKEVLPKGISKFDQVHHNYVSRKNGKMKFFELEELRQFTPELFKFIFEENCYHLIILELEEEYGRVKIYKASIPSEHEQRIFSNKLVLQPQKKGETIQDYLNKIKERAIKKERKGATSLKRSSRDNILELSQEKKIKVDEQPNDSIQYNGDGLQFPMENKEEIQNWKLLHFDFQNTEKSSLSLNVDRGDFFEEMNENQSSNDLQLNLDGEDFLEEMKTNQSSNDLQLNLDGEEFLEEIIENQSSEDFFWTEYYPELN